jgi:N-acyl-L-homoserine lactone synthetase
MYLIKTIASTDTTDPDYLAHGTVRHQVYVGEKRWIDPADANDGRETDTYDHQSHLAVGYDVLGEGTPCGSIRNIYRGSLSLPIERHFEIELDPTRAAIEVSRLAVPAPYRSTLLMIGLCRWVYADATDNGVDDMYALVELHLFRALNEIGFPFVKLAEPMAGVMGDPVMPIHCPVAEVLPGVARQDAAIRRRPLAPYFTRPFSEHLTDESVYQ